MVLSLYCVSTSSVVSVGEKYSTSTLTSEAAAPLSSVVVSFDCVAPIYEKNKRFPENSSKIETLLL